MITTPLFLIAMTVGLYAHAGPDGVEIRRERDQDGRLNALRFQDLNDAYFRGWAELKEGELVFFIRTRAEDRRSRVLFGRDVVRTALDEFGPRVRRISARWTDGDNRATYEAGRRAGLGSRAAAATTWTARTLRPFGFTRVGPVRMTHLYRDQNRVDCTFRRSRWDACRRWLTT